MPRRPRIQFPNAFYHVYNRGVAKKDIFFGDLDYLFFLKKLGEATVAYNVRVFAYCLMRNHYHLFIQTINPNLQKFMQSVQGQYAQLINLRTDRVGPLFQGRYKDKIVEADKYALTLTRYIHRNPVEIGYSKFESYRWSSYACYKTIAAAPKWLDTKFVVGFLGANRASAIKEFESFHERPLEGSDPYDPTF